jgi:hypothetical protein
MSLPKTSKLVLLGLLSIFILFLLILTFANFSSFDEQLRAEVKTLLEPKPMPESSENAYFAIWGLSASKDRDIVAAGKRLIERYQANKADRNKDELSEADYLEILGDPDLDKAWLNKFENCASRRKLSCAENLVKQLSSVSIQGERLSLLSQRYQTIIEMNDFQSVNEVTFLTPLPPYNVMMKLRQIYLAKAVRLPNNEQFILAMNKDISFWRMLLSNGDSLIDKMIAVASLWADFQAISDYLRSNPTLSEEQLEQLSQILVPLTKEELDISEAFEYEEKAFYNSLMTIDPNELSTSLGTSSTAVFWLTHPNATINDYHQYFVMKLKSLSQLPAESFAQAIKHPNDERKNCCFEEIDSLISISPSSLYNVGGKMLLSTMLFRAQDYVARVHDLNGIINLVKLQTILANSDESAETVVTNSVIRQPYNKQAFDLTNGILSFDCLDSNSICNVRIYEKD